MSEIPEQPQDNNQTSQQPVGGQGNQTPPMPPSGGGIVADDPKSRRKVILFVVLAAVVMVILYVVLVVRVVGGVRQVVGNAASSSSSSTSDSSSLVASGAVSSTSAIKTYDPANPDDGELHASWNSDVDYTATSQKYTYKANSEPIDNYQATFDVDFTVSYPQLSGDVANADAVNAEIRDTAMQFVDDVYLDYAANSDYVRFVETGVSSGSSPYVTGRNSPLEDTVDYAITYNSPDLVSISFNDHFIAGSDYMEFLVLRTVNVNLKTGELYTMDNSLSMTDQVAREWVDNLQSISGNSTVDAYGADETVAILTGRSSNAFRATPALFIDQDGHANVAVSYWFNGSDILVRGWWDVTPSSDALDAAKKSSTLWQALPQQ